MKIKTEEELRATFKQNYRSHPKLSGDHYSPYNLYRWTKKETHIRHGRRKSTIEIQEGIADVRAMLGMFMRGAL